MSDQAKTPRRGAQLLWFVALWASGVITLGIIGLLIKMTLRH